MNNSITQNQFKQSTPDQIMQFLTILNQKAQISIGNLITIKTEQQQLTFLNSQRTDFLIIVHSSSELKYFQKYFAKEIEKLLIYTCLFTTPIMEKSQRGTILFNGQQRYWSSLPTKLTSQIDINAFNINYTYFQAEIVRKSVQQSLEKLNYKVILIGNNDIINLIDEKNTILEQYLKQIKNIQIFEEQKQFIVNIAKQPKKSRLTKDITEINIEQEDNQVKMYKATILSMNKQNFVLCQEIDKKKKEIINIDIIKQFCIALQCCEQ